MIIASYSFRNVRNQRFAREAFTPLDYLRSQGLDLAYEGHHKALTDLVRGIGLDCEVAKLALAALSDLPLQILPRDYRTSGVLVVVAQIYLHPFSGCDSKGMDDVVYDWISAGRYVKRANGVWKPAYLLGYGSRDRNGLLRLAQDRLSFTPSLV